MTKVPAVALNNGVKMPQFGLGVWQASEGGEVERAVSTALEAGYRLIDTAAIYRNERGVGKAVKESGIERSEIFITTKLWNSHQGRDSALKAFDSSLDKLGIDYVDLYLIHWPMPTVGKFVETWKALEKIYADKRARAIGVSNFKPPHLEKLLAESSTVPAVNQIELHPRLGQIETRQYCQQHDIRIESYSPIMHGREILEDDTIKQIALSHGKTPAQIVLRWHIQNGLIVIPKSVTPSRIKENIDIFDFELTGEEMKAVDGLNQERRVGIDPDDFNS